MTVVEPFMRGTGTDGMPVYETGAVAGIDLSSVASGRGTALRNPQAQAMVDSGVDKYDIPAFLRRQSD
jgi:cell division protein FtsZ